MQIQHIFKKSKGGITSGKLIRKKRFEIKKKEKENPIIAPKNSTTWWSLNYNASG